MISRRSSKVRDVRMFAHLHCGLREAHMAAIRFACTLALVLIFAAISMAQTQIVTAGGGNSSSSGTVTSIAATVPSFMAITGSPVTTTGTLAFSFATQAQNLIFAAPCGSTGAVTFRVLCAADIPALAPSQIAGTAVITTDSRLSNARTPTAHATTHASAGSDPITISPAQVAGTAVVTADARLADARAPTAHATTHAAAGSDPVTVTEAQVAGLVTDLGSKQATGNYITGTTGDVVATGPGSVVATIQPDSVALGTDTTGSYAGSSSEGGPATTASALAANGTNCSAPNFGRGVDAAGNCEGAAIVASDLPSTTVTPGAYTAANITIDAQGRITTAANGSAGIGGTLGSTANVALRSSGTGGSTAQGSAVTISDVASSTVTVATTAGNAVSVVATAPAATTGASQAGKAVTVTASPAVASTDTAGAAAGGSVTITAGAAARNASGNANGGNINLVAGAGIGTGTAGQVIAPDGSLAAPGIAFNSSADLGISRLQSSVGQLSAAGSASMYWAMSAIGIGANTLYAGSAITTTDTALSRAGVAGVWKTNAADNSTPTWLQQTPARSYLASNFTNATTSPANTALSITVKASRKYSIKLHAFLADSVAADGVVFDFDGGASTVTNFRLHCTLFDTALNLSTQVTALATDMSSATLTGDSLLECYGGLEVNGAGTFILRAWQNSHTAGTLTVYRGSTMEFEDMP